MSLRVHRLPAPIRPLVKRPLQVVRNRFTPFASSWWRRLTGKPCTFDFGGKSYRYFLPLDKTARTCERAVELPIVWDRVRRADAASTLEIGNVLSNYFPVRHLVVDKYERVPGVVNEDVVDFSPPSNYNLIVSVSTLEHVGWDDPEPRDPPKILRAIDNLRSHLTEGGELFVTLPHGWNTELDRFISEGRIPFSEQRCLKRISADNRWQEVDCAELGEVAYGAPFNNANGITVGSIRRA
jgi:hypothetical protein